MLAFDALKAQLGSIRKKRDSVPAIEARLFRNCLIFHPSCPHCSPELISHPFLIISGSFNRVSGCVIE